MQIDGVGDREVAVVAIADRDAFATRLGDVGETPDRNAAPGRRIVGCGKNDQYFIASPKAA